MRPGTAPGFPEQSTVAPPPFAGNDVAEDGGEAIGRHMKFRLTTSAATVQRLMNFEMKLNRRQREVVMRASLLGSGMGSRWRVHRARTFPARVTGRRRSTYGWSSRLPRRQGPGRSSKGA